MNKEDERRIFLTASILLQYPEDNWYELLEEIEEETLKTKEERSAKNILEFLEYVKQTNKLDLKELYVETFDLSKESNLYLTFYSLEDKQDRGMTLLKLKQKYEEAGFIMKTSELPDFLPAVLEFTAATQRKDIIASYRAVIEKIFNNLFKENNPYSYILKSILLIDIDEENESVSFDKLDSQSNYVSVGGVVK
jgi:nitrate reductase delta subunit